MSNKKINKSDSNKALDHDERKTLKLKNNRYYRMPVMFRDDSNGGHPHLIYKFKKDGTIISIGLTHSYNNKKYPSTRIMSRNPLKEPSFIKDTAVREDKKHYRGDYKSQYAYLSKSDYKKVKKSVRNLRRSKSR